MREWSALILGERFDVHAFHHAWLQLGAVPMDIAEQQITQWVTFTKSL